jgi:hypothetical protein
VGSNARFALQKLFARQPAPPCLQARWSWGDHLLDVVRLPIQDAVRVGSSSHREHRWDSDLLDKDFELARADERGLHLRVPPGCLLEIDDGRGHGFEAYDDPSSKLLELSLRHDERARVHLGPMRLELWLCERVLRPRLNWKDIFDFDLFDLPVFVGILLYVISFGALAHFGNGVGNGAGSGFGNVPGNGSWLADARSLLPHTEESALGRSMFAVRSAVAPHPANDLLKKSPPKDAELFPRGIVPEFFHHDASGSAELHLPGSYSYGRRSKTSPLSDAQMKSLVASVGPQQAAGLLDLLTPSEPTRGKPTSVKVVFPSTHLPTKIDSAPSDPAATRGALNKDPRREQVAKADFLADASDALATLGRQMNTLPIANRAIGVHEAPVAGWNPGLSDGHQGGAETLRTVGLGTIAKGDVKTANYDLGLGLVGAGSSLRGIRGGVAKEKEPQQVDRDGGAPSVVPIAPKEHIPVIEEDDGMDTDFGGISRAMVRRVVFKHREELRRCYERELTRAQPDLAGKIAVTIELGTEGDGKPLSVSIQSSTTNDTDLDTCVKTVFAHWEFPKARGGNVFFTYPVVFQRTSDDINAGSGSGSSAKPGSTDSRVK